MKTFSAISCTVALVAVLISGISLTIVGCTGNGGSTTVPNTTPVTTVVSSNKPLIVAAITASAEIGTNQALKALANKNPNAANETSAALRNSIQNELIPYLRGSNIGSSAVIKELINTSLFKNVDPTIKNAIAAAGAVLDAYLGVPSANAYLSPDQIDYLVAFLTGIQKGCNDFNSRSAPHSLWFDVE